MDEFVVSGLLKRFVVNTRRFSRIIWSTNQQSHLEHSVTCFLILSFAMADVVSKSFNGTSCRVSRQLFSLTFT